LFSIVTRHGVFIGGRIGRGKIVVAAGDGGEDLDCRRWLDDNRIIDGTRFFDRRFRRWRDRTNRWRNSRESIIEIFMRWEGSFEEFDIVRGINPFND
jgi:hypothetical protein